MEKERKKSYKTFEDIRVWQDARELVKYIYDVSTRTEFARDFGLRDQIRRAAVSIMSNIAEGFDRRSDKEFVQFLYIAKASAAEVRSQLYVALDLDYLEDSTFQDVKRDLISISKQLSDFIRHLSQKE